MSDELSRILDDASRGRFPAPDGRITVVGQPSARDAGVVAFTAHAVVFTDEDPGWVREQVASAPSDPLSAPMNPVFLAALLARTGRWMSTIDQLAVAGALPGAPEIPLREIDDPAHPRVAWALAHRDEVRVWAADGGVVMLGRGVAGRWECAIELDERARGRGLGAVLARAARQLVPGDAVWAQIAPGNARSVRAFRSAGFVPVGSEALFSVSRRPE
ncbi:GNAT family N-acetyltransferase [Streptomyces sp. NPDC020875]|uniref:GNAT family N-acetyltransferase n=1 Tax=Streptomyces sp. NPDC020875 TaxID=3154898 RepID=UPI0033F5269C